MTNRNNDNSIVIVGTLIVLVCIAGLMFGLPQYGVWTKTLEGKGALQAAEYTRQTRIIESEAQLKAAENEAKANKILSESLTPNVIQYEWIRSQEKDHAGDRTIIYIPTNPNSGVPIGLPVTESQRLNK
jgi:hypothetical protein